MHNVAPTLLYHPGLQLPEQLEEARRVELPNLPSGHDVQDACLSKLFVLFPGGQRLQLGDRFSLCILPDIHALQERLTLGLSL